MSLPSVSRQLRPRSTISPCILCQHHQVATSPTRRLPNTSYAPRRTEAALPRYASTRTSPTQGRTPSREQAEATNRLLSYKAAETNGVIKVDAQKADAVYSDFARGIKADHKDNVVRVAKTHAIRVSDVKDIALITCRIPEPRDRFGRIYETPHFQMGAKMLLGCSKAGDLAATLHILAATHYSNHLPTAAKLAKCFSMADIEACRKILFDFSTAEDPEAMAMNAVLLEKQGLKTQALTLLRLSLNKARPENFNVKEDPISFPVPTPWNELGSLLLVNDTPESRKEAYEVFLKGAEDFDDPVAYYYLAQMQSRKDSDRVKYMTKAAASGYTSAAYDLAEYYMGANPETVSDPSMRSVFDWLQRRKGKGPLEYAQEWFRVAMLDGHKGAMLRLIEIHEQKGLPFESPEMQDLLARLTAPPPPGDREQWPEAVAAAKSRLLRARVG